ncbi:hypothetical protein [Burkholderia multivorans]|uniref:hypothetical protein n=1 Tax=Burkholderia multivorans TaxID=87883 RepID=UPI001C20F996|nr:hypothetical protein [Burkholderia multivorans]MBU9308326.1 hypothetical protein [Burkholderia multivorans]
MAEIDVKKLRELAKAALWTGDWYDAGCNTLMCTYPENSGDLSGESDEIAHPCPLGLVGYMEAAQPKAVLALCDRLEAAEKDARRYRWMADRFIGADFKWGRDEDGYEGVPALIIVLPDNAKVWGSLDLTIDDQLGRTPASEGEQK